MNDTLKLLVIEGDESDFRLLAYQLRQQEPEAICFRVSTEEGLCAALEEGGWDAILSDYPVPGVDFLETLGRVRRFDPALPVILVSGSVGEDEAAEWVRQGAWDFVAKSRLSCLSSAIRRSLREAREHQARLAAEDALRQRDALLEAFFRASPVGMAVLDTDFRHMQANGALAEITGAPLAAHLGRTVRELVPGLAPKIEAMLEAVVLTRQPLLNVEMSNDIQASQGMQRHWLVSHFPIFDAAGKVVALGGVVNEISERKRAEEALRKSEHRARDLLAENRRLTQRTFKLLEQERRHLARELHDELGQWLTAIQTEAESLHMGAHSAATLAGAQAISESATEVNAVIRRLVSELRPALLDTLGLPDSLRELISQWKKHQPGVRCELLLEGELDGDLESMGEALNITAYRIVQEGLTNIAKHAQAGKVIITLRRAAGEPGTAGVLCLSLENDGMPLLPDAKSRGMGLLGMRERAAALGGEFSLSSLSTGGARIDVMLPIARRLPREAP
jgi:PAS domain S-box-containing protein